LIASHGRFLAFVAMAPADPLIGLLLRVDGEYAEDGGYGQREV
jgi:hypothetical protein